MKAFKRPFSRKQKQEEGDNESLDALTSLVGGGDAKGMLNESSGGGLENREAVGIFTEPESITCMKAAASGLGADEITEDNVLCGAVVPMAASSGSAEIEGNPIASDSDGSHNGVLSGRYQRAKIQTLTEAGATAWEVRSVWLLKRSANFMNKVSTAVVKISASKFFIGCVSLAVLGYFGFLAWQGPQRHVHGFLRGIGMERYTSNFLAHRYTLLEDLLHISDEDDLIRVGIEFPAERKRFLRHAQALLMRSSILLTIFWGSFLTMVIASAVLLVCVLVFAEARSRVGCCLLWFSFMAWYRIRLWCRLWNCIRVDCTPRLEYVPEPLPRTPDSTANPPSDSVYSGIPQST